MTWRWTCPHCGERIGIYEPAVVVEPEGLRVTSVAREPELRNGGTRIVLHATCATEQAEERR